MTRIPASCLPSADAVPWQAASMPAPEPERAGAAAPGGTLAALKTRGAAAKRPLRAVGGRCDETVERLGRLRTELGRIDPPPDCAEAAHDAILAAMARAGLGNWTVPALHDAATLAYHDGSRRIDLISHAVTFNPWGAFRIVDLRAGSAVYFEMAGAEARAFAAPRDRRSGGGPAARSHRLGGTRRA